MSALLNHFEQAVPEVATALGAEIVRQHLVLGGDFDMDALALVAITAVDAFQRRIIGEHLDSIKSHPQRVAKTAKVAEFLKGSGLDDG